MQLIKDEVVVKEFEYATAKRGTNHIACSVTVTNKRIYTTDVSNRQVAHTEIPLEKVKSIHSTFVAPNNWVAYMCIAYAVMCAILGIALYLTQPELMEPKIMLLLLLVVLTWVISAIVAWQFPTFVLDFTTFGREGKPLYTSIAKLIPSKGRSGRFKIHLNRSVCEEFMNTIGAALTEARIIAEQDTQKAE